MILGKLVKGGGNYIALYRTANVCDLFRALVDQQNNDFNIRMIDADGVGDLFEQCGFARFGRRYQKAPLPSADRGDQIHQTGSKNMFVVFQGNAFIGIDRGEVVEIRPLPQIFRRIAVDGFDINQCVEFLVCFSRVIPSI